MQHERDAVAGRDVELSFGVEVSADELDGRREEERVRPCDGEQPFVAPPHPRDDRAVVEPDAQTHPHRDGPLDALDDAHDIRRLPTRRHEVDQADQAVLAHEFCLEDERVVSVSAPGGSDLARGHERPPAVLLAPEKRGEAGARVEAWEAEPVDAAVSRHERRRLQVADEAVILDPCGHDAHASSPEGHSGRAPAQPERCPSSAPGSLWARITGCGRSCRECRERR